MSPNEVNDILGCVSKLDFASMDLQDQALYISAVCVFAEKMKPLVVKYSGKLQDNSTFLFKM